MKIFFAVAALAIAVPWQVAPTRPPLPIVTPVVPLDYGSWHVTASEGFAEAMTANASGSTFGLICAKTCSWYLDFQRRCEDDDDYPAMMNSAAGAIAIQLKCAIVEADGKARYILLFREDLIDTIKKGGEVGFAVPLASGAFSVSRFSLTGSIPAVSLVIRISKNMDAKSQKELRDFTI